MFKAVDETKWHMIVRLGKVIDVKTNCRYFYIPFTDRIIEIGKESFSSSVQTNNGEVSFKLQVSDPKRVGVLFYDQYDSAAEAIIHELIHDWSATRDVEKLISWRSKIINAIESHGFKVISSNL